MKWQILACLLVLLGCGRENLSRSENNETLISELEAENSKLREQNVQMGEVNRQQSEMVAEYTEKLNQILDSLNAITGKQEEINQLTYTIEGGAVSTRYNIDEQIQENLAEIDERLRESHRHQEDIQKLEDRYEGRIKGLKENLERLNQLLADKEKEIEELRQRVGELEFASQTLQRESAEKQSALEESQRTLNRLEEFIHDSFYIVGTKRELRSLSHDGILERQRRFRGSFYSASPLTHQRADLRSHFRTVNPREEKILVGYRIREAEIVSLHREHRGLYAFTKEGENILLTLHDPLKFWGISKFLVVQIED